MAPDAVVALGKALVELLEQGGQEDITAHWMAHYLAELMERARTATEPARQQTQKEAADLILELWRHRTYLPGRYPLARFEPVLRTLDRLSGTDPWHRPSSRPPPVNGTGDPVHQWLKRAEAIDDASKTAIRSCLDQAIAAATETEGKWLDLLKDLRPSDDEVPTIILRIVGIEGKDVLENDAKKEELQRAIVALDVLKTEMSRLLSEADDLP